MMHQKVIILIFSLLSFCITRCSEKHDLTESNALDIPEDLQKYQASAPSLDDESPDLKTIYFETNSSILDKNAKENLRFNANWLQKNPKAYLQIEGYCDERGSIEYNLTLGERRAKAARDYLVELGIDPDRVNTVSYGRTGDKGNKKDWKKNRRCGFFISYPDDAKEED